MAQAPADARPTASKDGDPFPETPRYVYKLAPLIRVTIQLRFPPVLRIQSQPPAEFQERVRGVFPLLERGVPPLPLPGQQIPPEILQFLAAGAVEAPYRFLTENRSTTLTLAADSTTLTTSDYKTWEDFKKFFLLSFEALIQTYAPSFFSRVGLRYVNAIDRKRIGLEGEPWSRLLRQEILGELAIQQLENRLEDARRVLRLRMPNGSILLQHGTAKVVGHVGQCYTIDCDFFSNQKTEKENAQQLLDQFNDRAFRVFRWCISDTLHDALGPVELARAGEST